jgi:hypothetical protein
MPQAFAKNQSFNSNRKKDYQPTVAKTRLHITL